MVQKYDFNSFKMMNSDKNMVGNVTYYIFSHSLRRTLENDYNDLWNLYSKAINYIGS